MTYIVRKATFEDCALLAPNLRTFEVKEIWAMSKMTPMDALKYAFNNSIFAYTWIVNDVPACMFGLRSDSFLDDNAFFWMLTTHVIEKHKKSFYKESLIQTRKLTTIFPKLFGYVDARYISSINWIRRLGFTIEPALPIGELNLLFHRFSLGDYH